MQKYPFPQLAMSLALLGLVPLAGCDSRSAEGDSSAAPGSQTAPPQVESPRSNPIAGDEPSAPAKAPTTESGEPVPRAVLEAAEKLAGDVELRFSDLAKGGEEFGDWYEVSFRTKSGGEGHLSIRPTGEVFEGFVEMKPEEFPEAVRLAFEKRAPGGRFESSGMAITPEGTMYGGDVRIGDQEWSLGFDAEGKLVHEKRER